MSRKCEHLIWENDNGRWTVRGRKCSFKAVVEHNDNHYCKMHYNMEKKKMLHNGCNN